MTNLLPIKNKTTVGILEALRGKSGGSPCVKISYEKMRWLCRYPVWNMVCEFIRSTRSYSEGLALSVALISTAERHSGRMTKSENDLYRDFLWKFHLDMLDKLDMWAEYLDCFSKLRDNTQYCHKWKRTSGIDSHPHISHYVCGESPDYVLVHFLIGRHERKEIIQRKLERLNVGKTIRHLQHHRRSTLSPDELRKRVESLVEKFTPYMPLC